MLLLVALSLAAAALALLVSRAELTRWAREAAPGMIRQGLECTFCTSFWFAAGLTVLWPPPGLPLTVAVLATWGGAAVAAALADR